MIPEWLHLVAIISLVVAGICFLIIVWDLVSGNKQKMWIMNLVWPITALYAGPLALIGYFKAGRLSTSKKMEEHEKGGGQSPGMQKPFWQKAAVGSTHCGAGCSLGDLVAEWVLFASPIVIFGNKMFGEWLLDFVLAYLFGIAFQYFSIKPMKDLSPREGLWAAIKADTLSLTAWQAGMYGWMAISMFLIFKHEIPQNDPVFWFLMQIAMLTGFLTSYPVNWWLITKGIKEAM